MTDSNGSGSAAAGVVANYACAAVEAELNKLRDATDNSANAENQETWITANTDHEFTPFCVVIFAACLTVLDRARRRGTIDQKFYHRHVSQMRSALKQDLLEARRDGVISIAQAQKLIDQGGAGAS